MSKIALTPNASGTGTFTIASPNSNTDRTLTLPDAAGTVLVDDGGGNVAVTGNLLVGALSAAGKITVSYVGSSGFGSSWSSTTTTGYALVFNTSSGQAGNIYVDTTTTAYNTSSDYRLKEDVQPMVGASGRLMALKPVNFAWKANGSRVDGFLAHEAQEVVPEAVTGQKDAVDNDGKPHYQGIDQSKLVPLLTAALQEALTKIEALEARVAQLEGASA